MGVAVNGRGLAGLAIATVLVTAWIFTGCGSDNSTTASATDKSSESTVAESTTTEIPSGPLTKAEFVKSADEICKNGLAKKDEGVLSLAKLAAENGKPASPKALEKVVTVAVIPAYNEILEQLGQLEPAAGDEAKVKKILDGYETTLEAAEADPIKATEVDMFADPNDAADAYGLESCRF
jgi:hypothetical protein